MKRLAALSLAIFCAGALAQADNQFDPGYKPREASPGAVERERPDWKDPELKLPPYPKPENFLEFEVRANRSFRFFVDAESIFAGSGDVVRYTTVVRSGSGTLNVSFDGLRCSTVEHRVYATGRSAEQIWSPVQDGKWKVLGLGAPGRQHLVLMRDFFCPAGIAITTREEGVDALRRGGHPLGVSNHPQFAPR